MSDAELLDLLRLNLVSGIGPRISSLLLARFGSARAVIEASGPELLEVEGIGPKLSVAITRARQNGDAEEELARCREMGVTLLVRGTPDYPAELNELPDAPAILYCRGERQPRDSLAVAIVGTRKCSHYGRQTAERLGSSLARAGVTIVSGMARGIDTAAHQGALSAGGRTIAVWGTGLNHLYPPENGELAVRIADAGCILSEAPLDRGPAQGVFPQRNRIIAGLCLGTIIVEAARGSGALHTARHANEQGREVFAVPGQIDNLNSLGCHDLIKDGATIVRGVDDILEALGPLMQPVRTSPDEVVHSPRELSLNDQERAVLNAVSREPTLIDAILRSIELEPSRVLSTLTILEMKRLIRRLPGGFVARP
jgi:DNA processing protein